MSEQSTKLFGTDGIRGIAGQYPLDAATVYRLGRALASSGKKRVIIGRDTRGSGVWLEQIIEQAVHSHGGQAALAKVITTPGVAFLSRSVPFDAGIVISASHNPYEDNGIKIFSQQGVKLTDDEEEQLERAVRQEQDTELPSFAPSDVSNESGWREVRAFDPDWVHRYLSFLKETISAQPLNGLRLVLDCANGATFSIAPRVFEELGGVVIPLNVEPTGKNINHDCGSVHPERMARQVVRSQAAFGVAFDGDGDRAILADETGRLLDGDHVLYLLARHFKDRGQLDSGCVVSTVMANMGLELALQNENLRVVRTKVGDRYVLEEMLRGGHSLGGEQSGHIIMRTHSLAGDGILTALQIAQILAENRHSLSDLVQGMEKFPQVVINVRIREKRDFSQISEIQREIETVEQALKNRGRVVVRYSGTEPVVRIMLEGENQVQIARYADAIAGQFRKKLGS